MRLSCLVAEPLAPLQRDIEQAQEGESERNLADFIDRLSARFGARRVTNLALVDTHIPEFSVAAGPGKALVIMVSEDGQVENRIIDTPSGLPVSALTEASNYLNARLTGRTIDTALTFSAGGTEPTMRT